MDERDRDAERRRELARRRLAEREARLNGREPEQRRARFVRVEDREYVPQRTNPALAALDAAASAVRANPRRVLAIVGIAVALALVFVAVFAVRGCVAPVSDAPASDEAPADAPSEQPSQRDPVDEAALASVLGNDLAARLIAAAEANDDAAWIAAHPDAYAVDGDAVQYKLLKLAATEPEAVPFVRGFPDAYPAEAAEPADDPAPGEVPRLYQWDPRWGATVYSSTAFAVTGCCPTSLAMVCQGLTGKADLSPYDLGVKAQEGGYMAQFDGTDSSFLINEAASLGLSCEPLAADAGGVRSALEGGAVLICNVGPGDFTDNGHFFVITGIDGDGNLAINDPYSAERSNRAWSVDDVLGQTKALWAYRLA